MFLGYYRSHGSVAEWSNAPHLKCGRPQGLEGSNPSASAVYIMKNYVFRLHPGQDLKKAIYDFVTSKNIKAGIILTCVGSLQKAVIRMAGAKEVKTYDDAFEIVSLVGTVESGNGHLHISISDKDGAVLGGHLKDGCIVGTTAEVVIGELEDLAFLRKPDAESGYDELVVE